MKNRVKQQIIFTIGQDSAFLHWLSKSSPGQVKVYLWSSDKIWRTSCDLGTSARFKSRRDAIRNMKREAGKINIPLVKFKGPYLHLEYWKQSIK